MNMQDTIVRPTIDRDAAEAAMATTAPQDAGLAAILAQWQQARAAYALAPASATKEQDAIDYAVLTAAETAILTTPPRSMSDAAAKLRLVLHGMTEGETVHDEAALRDVIAFIEGAVPPLPPADDELIELGRRWRVALDAEAATADAEAKAYMEAIDAIPFPDEMRMGADPAVEDLKIGLPMIRNGDGRYIVVAQARPKVVSVREAYAKGRSDFARNALARCDSILQAMDRQEAQRSAIVAMHEASDVKQASVAAFQEVTALDAAIIAMPARTLAGLRVKAEVYAEYADAPEDDLQSATLWSLLRDLGQRHDNDDAHRWLDTFLKAGGSVIANPRKRNKDGEPSLMFGTPVESDASLIDLDASSPLREPIIQAARRRMRDRGVDVLSGAQQ